MRTLRPFNKKLFLESLEGLDDALAGKPGKSFTKVEFPILMSPSEVKAARKSTQLSQPRFAAALGISPGTVRSWENGRRHPRGLESKVLRAAALEPKFIELMAQL